MPTDTPTASRLAPEPAAAEAATTVGEAGWPEVDLAAWRAAAEAGLKGADFERRLVSHTEDGLRTEPLYTAADLVGLPPTGAPGAYPYTRGGRAVAGWQCRVRVAEPAPAAAGRVLAHDLSRGADAATLVVASPCRAGVAIHRLPELAAVLDGVDLAQVPLALDAGPRGVAAAALLLARARHRGVSLAAGGDLGLNPWGTLWAEGQAGGSLDGAVARTAALAAWLVRSAHTGVRAVNIDAGPWQQSGASAAEALGLALAGGVAALRALTGVGGLTVAEAAGQIAFTVELDAGFFGGIAALRALRSAWSRVLAVVLGVESAAAGAVVPPAHIQARPAWRMFTRRDPWVNLLRNTAACFAGAVGGAEVVCPLPFDAALGRTDDMARRIARNTLTILAHESYLGAVVDPAGGAYFLEARTEQLAVAAWTWFQAIEARGGLAAALANGMVAERIGSTAAARAQRIATRLQPVLGVSAFPHLDEAAVQRPAEVPAAPDEAGSPPGALPALAAVRAAAEAANWGAAVAAAIDAAAEGATLGDLSAALRAGDQGSGADGQAWFEGPPRRADAAPFEALRDASDGYLARTGHRPQVFLATLGPLAAHTARAGFATQLLAAGGVEAVWAEAEAVPGTAAEAVVPEPGAEAPSAAEAVEALAAAFARSGLRYACICGTDADYVQSATPLAAALRASGAQGVWLAGRPGVVPLDGINECIFLGCDALAALGRLHAALEVKA